MSFLVGVQTNSKQFGGGSSNNAQYGTNGWAAVDSGSATKAFFVPTAGTPSGKVTILVYTENRNTLLGQSVEYAYNGSEDGTTPKEVALLVPVDIVQGTIYKLAVYQGPNSWYVAATGQGTSGDNSSVYPTPPVPLQEITWTPGESPTVWLEGGAAATGPSITDVTPTRSTESFTITGTEFGDAQGTVTLGGVAQTVTGWTPTAILCTCNRGTLKYGQYDVLVTAADAQTATAPTDLLPPTDWDYINLAGTLAPAGNRITTTAVDLVAGDQLSYQAVISGQRKVDFYADGSFVCDISTTGFFVSAWDASAPGWSSNAVQTISAVADVAPVITTTSLGATAVGTPYSLQLVATGTVPITWTRFAGTIPAGLSLSTSGLLSGTPTGSGAAYNFTVEASNVAGADTQVYTGDVGEAPAFTGVTVPLLRVGVPYSATIQHTGYPAPTFTVTAGSMPAGMTLSSAGLVSGTPTTAGPYSVTIRATNAYGTADRTVNDEVQPAFALPVITTTVLPAMFFGIPYDQTIVFTGNPTPVISLEIGPLPAGLLLEPDGRIHGTPSANGPYDFTVAATNSQGVDYQQYTGTVSNALTAPVITTTVLGAMTTGVAFSDQIDATGNPAPTFATQSGTIPAGLSISSAGLITGTPTTAGAYSWTVRATNSQGFDDQLYTGSVIQGAVAPIISSTPLPVFFFGIPYDENIQLTQGTAPVTFSIFSGAFPTGITMDSTGHVTGTATNNGQVYNVTVRATNAQGFDDQTYSGNVSNALAPPTIQTTVLQPMYVNLPFSQMIQHDGNPAPTLAVLTGTLPAGLTLDTTGLLHGTPTIELPYSFTVAATNSQGTATQPYTGSVTTAPPVPLYATINEAIMIVTGGPTLNEGQMAWFKGKGASGTTFEDLESSWLANEGFSAGSTEDNWFAYLGALGYNGSSDDRKLQFWRNGGN